MEKSWKNHLNITWKKRLTLKLNVEKLFYLMKLYKLRNSRLQTWLNQNTYLFVLLFIAVWIARYQLLNLFFASHQSGRLYTMIDHWRCLVFSWLILYQHTVDNFSLYVPIYVDINVIWLWYVNIEINLKTELHLELN